MAAALVWLSKLADRTARRSPPGGAPVALTEREFGRFTIDVSLMLSKPDALLTTKRMYICRCNLFDDRIFVNFGWLGLQGLGSRCDASSDSNVAHKDSMVFLDCRDSTWCTFGSMQVPDLDWKSIMASAKTGHVSFMTGCNEYHLPSGVTIQVVDREEQLGGALAALRESMQASAPL